MLFHCKYSRQFMSEKRTQKYWLRRKCGTKECAVERRLPRLRYWRRRQCACPLLCHNGVITNRGFCTDFIIIIQLAPLVLFRHNTASLYCAETIQCTLLYREVYIIMTSIPRFSRGLHRADAKSYTVFLRRPPICSLLLMLIRCHWQRDVNRLDYIELLPTPRPVWLLAVID